MSFTHDDVQRIIQLLDASHFDELHLEADGIKLDLRRNSGASTAMSDASTMPSMRQGSSAKSVSAPQSPNPEKTAAPSSGADESGASSSGQAALLEIKAPMLGTFYRAPKPGADPFIAEGSKVEPETVVGIIEVMKLMNSVPANITGEVVEVVAQDGELVEYDQVLFRVRP
ncbi:acetyl-CoA carboxylase biotin carboxyl carrier protein [Neopusillimonas maritima]|uniref:Biotin carboxyl carrier protein of acetyl-CoA carboxylase n=1 Tax=Neopusillimonas maritima TaxID=2026239 RepID=A0A3A1YSQ6_9BURK|nr:acetyl-CoA carboxylase biotin carboxyl carrier protein [Neopusillimonas maritima]RIY41252.1 acetyl-CoA carboxylase, biotin carboxyl carrier protein [Neopusillimonas maritima]